MAIGGPAVGRLNVGGLAVDGLFVRNWSSTNMRSGAGISELEVGELVTAGASHVERPGEILRVA